MKLDRIIAFRNDRTVYRDGELCMKVFGASHKKSDVISEALNQTRIEEVGLRVPTVRSVSQIDGKWTIISDYIKGNTLASLMQANPEKKNEYLKLFTDIQLEMNQKSCLTLPRLDDRLRRRIIQTDYSATVRYDLCMRIEQLQRQLGLCHGDFVPENIIISDDGLWYVLDFPHLSEGDPAFDAANTYMLLVMEGDIEGAETYLELYCKKSNTDIEYVKKWLPIVAAARSLGSFESEREFLDKYVK
ncbi:MAG: phosphotransferase [Clostridiales bacterium]|nr:phosphotransferase [Clostridiales bacterium]